MSSKDLALSVRDLGKAYQIVHRNAENATLREALVQRLRRPLQRVQCETFWALRDVSFEVHRGDVLGIIGRNGAGKSTLLKVLSRITEPTTGAIDLYGRVGSLLEVGTGFHPELTGRENIFLNGSILGMKRREIADKFDEIVDFAGTERFLDTPVKRYSSGMFVRLAFAVAAHLNPEILIVDEVLAVGDAEFQKKCLGKMEEVAGGGRTVLFVSHNMATVRSLCTRAILVDGGHVVERGTPDECISAYLSLHRPAKGTGVIQLERPANAPAWMREIRLYCGSTLGTRLEMGQELALEIDFVADDPVRPALGVVISNDNDVPVLHYSSRYALPPSWTTPKRQGTLRCDFGVVPFTGGEFQMTLHFGGAVSDFHMARSCVEFEVLERDVFGVGRAYESKHSLLWWPTEMSIREDAAVA